MQRDRRVVHYEGAFQCAQCPGNADPAKGRACPAWWEWLETREASEGPKEQRIVEQCGLSALHEWQHATMNNSTFAVQNAVDARNEIAKHVAEAQRQAGELQRVVAQFLAGVRQLQSAQAAALITEQGQQHENQQALQP